MRIWSTSIAKHRVQHADEPMMVLLMVADGVGGGRGGKTASATAPEAVWRYLTRSWMCVGLTA
jgi:serine/threonine protein phosphatase PrpC